MDDRTLIKAAVLYYEHEMTHEEIAVSLGWSRVRVTRALKEARNRGLVEFVIKDPVAPFEYYERAMLAQYEPLGLRSCRIAPSLGDPARTLTGVGRTAAATMEEFLPRDGAVAVSMSRAVSALVNQLTGVARPDVTIAAAGGSTARTTFDTSSALAIELARRLDGHAYTVPGPLRADAQIVAALRKDPDIADALSVAANATHLIVGVGSMNFGGGRTVDTLTPERRDALQRRGAVGDFVSRFIDADAEHVVDEQDDALLALTFEQVRAIPHKLVVGAGSEKGAAVQALLSRGQITDLAIDLSLARTLLATPIRKERTA